MAINTGNGSRQGIIGKRTQSYNPKTDKYVKRDTNTGRFLSCKDTPFKNIRKEVKKDVKDVKDIKDVKKADSKEVKKIIKKK